VKNGSTIVKQGSPLRNGRNPREGACESLRRQAAGGAASLGHEGKPLQIFRYFGR